ncbi:hypothetical protein O1611_g3512 [Lasiodiplodia mahajangana]|uniref:Uncharacterized protein n=1 Tax=Lasiodiplodia mahajangana TaxID=1108764 RepID=A0ACC2JRJ1_9PEZI|nr:hypothetical protein O1611_g3512 [Lasiodiplodia mahajangana]
MAQSIYGAQYSTVGTQPRQDSRSTSSGFEMQQRWQDALSACEKELGDEDFAFIRRFETHDQLLKEVDTLIWNAKEASVPRLLRQLKPHIDHIQIFFLGALIALDFSSTDTVCIWGLVTLMLQLAARSEDVLSTITQMWSDIGNNLQVFEVYQDHIAEDAGLGLIVFEVMEEVQKLAVFTIKTLKYVRKGKHQFIQQLNSCKTQFEQTSQYISHRIHMTREKITAKQLVSSQQVQREEAITLLPGDQGASASITSQEPTEAQLPCFYVPFQANDVFHGREGVLAAIGERLIRKAGARSIPSVALWATAGIGKTQIALEYAYRQRAKGVKAIFWIETEHESEYMKSFTEIAHVLELPGATTSKGHDTNRLLVIKWLQETKVPWLLIFDNVEDQSVLNRLSPSDGPGSIIVTCRSELTAASTAHENLEILPFSISEGGELLLRELGFPTNSSQDKDLSNELSSLLGGHALTLNVMARNIKARKKGLREFVQMYKDNPRSLHRKPRRILQGLPNQYYGRDDDLESLWAIPFSELQPDESHVFGILAMCGPNNIPSHLLRAKAFGGDQYDSDEITVGLRGLALCSTNSAGTMFSVHRLVQGEFRNYIGLEDQVKRWTDAVMAIRERFPRQHKGFTMFNDWKLCESLVEHVEAVAFRYRELSEKKAIAYSEEFIYLVADASRYLLEIGRYNAGTRLLDHGFHHAQGEKSIPYTNLCVNMGHVYCERGQDKRALDYNDIVLRIRESSLEPSHSEIANALSNSALSMVGCGRDLEKAYEMLKRSLKIDLANNPEDHKKVLHLRHFNIAFALRALGRCDEARTHVEQAAQYAIAEFGPCSRYLTIAYRMYADFECRVGNWGVAYTHAKKAHDIAEMAGATTPWVAAALYYMGSIKIKQQLPLEAM